MAISRARRKSTFGADGAPTVLTAPTAITTIESVVGSTADSAQVTYKATDPGGFNIKYDKDYLSHIDKIAYTNESRNL